MVVVQALCLVLAACDRNDPDAGARPGQGEGSVLAQPDSSAQEPAGDSARVGSTSSPAPPVETDDVETQEPILAENEPQKGPPPPTFTPLVDAVGREWAEYAALDGRALRYDVIEAAVTTVRTRVQVFEGGKPLGEPAMREDEHDVDPLARRAHRVSAQRSAGPASIEAAGRRWDALLYEDHWTDEEVHYLRRTWVSPDVPVFGTIRMELHGDGRLEGRLELTGFGAGR